MTDVRADGILRVNFPNGPESMLATCSLDLANEGPRTLEQIAVLMGMSRERVRQLEERALAKLRFAIREGDLDYEGSELESIDGAEVIEEVVARQRRQDASEALAERRAAEAEAKRAAKKATKRQRERRKARGRTRGRTVFKELSPHVP